MLITISGTPGTGKTNAAKIAAEKLGARLITTNYLVRKYKLESQLDRKRRTMIIDTKKLSAAAEKEAAGITIFEGHLSHFAKADISIILRTSPQELEKRLRKKGWSKKKVNENVEAEAIGVISEEATAFEINTTTKSPQQTASAIIKIIKSHSSGKKYSKRIDWTKQYEKYLR